MVPTHHVLLTATPAVAYLILSRTYVAHREYCAACACFLIAATDLAALMSMGTAPGCGAA